MKRACIGAAILLLCFVGRLAGQELVLTVEEVSYQDQPIDDAEPPQAVNASLETLAVPGRPFFARAVRENQEQLVSGRLEASRDGGYRIELTYHHREATLPDRRRIVGGSREGMSLSTTFSARAGESIDAGGVHTAKYSDSPGDQREILEPTRSSLRIRVTLRPFDPAAEATDAPPGGLTLPTAAPSTPLRRSSR